jgi:predicted acetyltransferase
MTFELVQPTLQYLPGYVDALKRGWHADNMRGADAIQEDLDAIERDAALFVARRTDIEAKGPGITLPDGTVAKRIPGYVLWMWDGEFCGLINLRWRDGTHELPPTCLGHIGYSVVPWKRRRGYATAALAMILKDVPARGLKYAELTTDVDNFASRKVIEANGGVLVEEFTKTAHHGGTQGLRYRIAVG